MMKSTVLLLMAAAAAVPLPAYAGEETPPTAGQTAHSAEWQAARDTIWPQELSIYAGRGKGDLKPYLAGLADGYVSWPPFNPVPKGRSGLEQTGRIMAGKDQEELAMEFLDLALNGDTAVIYYRTHRTRLSDGTPADQRFEVTHTWVKRDGVWKVLGGMARSQPERTGSYNP